MGRADPRRGQDRSPTISVSLTTANSPQTVTSGEGQAAGARCWRLTCSRTLPGAKAIVFCKRWCGTSGRCPLLRGACSPQAACRAPETSITSARALCRSLQTVRVPRGQGGAPSPNLLPTSENSRQEKTPNSRGSWQPLNPAERFLQITPYSRDRGRTPHVPASTVCGFSAAWAHLGAGCSPVGGRCFGRHGRPDRPGSSLLRKDVAPSALSCIPGSPGCRGDRSD